MSDTPASFAHITVTPEEEDDLVIEAGVRARASEAPASNPASPEPAEAPDAAEAPAPEPVVPAASASGKAAAARKEPARTAKAPAAYEQTTLDDLKGEPMSLTQKVVIVAAVVCLIGAIAYYFLFMR